MYKWIRMRLVWKPEGKIDDVALVVRNAAMHFYSRNCSETHLIVWIILITSARHTDVVVLDGLEMLKDADSNQLFI